MMGKKSHRKINTKEPFLLHKKRSETYYHIIRCITQRQWENSLRQFVETSFGRRKSHCAIERSQFKREQQAPSIPFLSDGCFLKRTCKTCN